MKAYGEVLEQVQPFSALTLNGGELLASRSGRLNPADKLSVDFD